MSSSERLPDSPRAPDEPVFAGITFHIHGQVSSSSIDSGLEPRRTPEHEQDLQGSRAMELTALYLRPQWAGWTEGKITRLIEQNGGKVSRNIENPSISHIILSEHLWYVLYSYCAIRSPPS
jgi:hypothetical protein